MNLLFERNCAKMILDILDEVEVLRIIIYLKIMIIV